MGMSSSQARLLNLTARMHQIEYKAAKLEAQKLQMANESVRVYNEYLNALDATKIQAFTLATDGTLSAQNVTLAALENVSNNFAKTLYLTEPETGKMYITNAMKTKYHLDGSGVVGDEVTFMHTAGFESVILGYDSVANTTPTITYTGADNYIGATTVTRQVPVTPPTVGFQEVDPINVNVPADAISMSTVNISDNFDTTKTYSISSAADLVKLKTMTNDGKDTQGVNFVLTQDIYMDGVTGWEGIGKGATNNYTNAFKGIFDGNGFTVYNLSGSNGLFGAVYGNQGSVTDVHAITPATYGVVKNVNVSNANVTSTGSNRGVLAGYVRNAYIENVSVSGSITGAGWVGGVSGQNEYSVIKNATSAANVNATSSCIGGLIGHDTSGTVVNCVSSGDVIGGSNVGGLIGHEHNGGSGQIYSCSANNSSVRRQNGDTSTVGIFIGAVDNSCTATVTDSKYNSAAGVTNTVGSGAGNVQSANSGDAALVAAQMKNVLTTEIKLPTQAAMKTNIAMVIDKAGITVPANFATKLQQWLTPFYTQDPLLNDGSLKENSLKLASINNYINAYLEHNQNPDIVQKLVNDIVNKSLAATTAYQKDYTITQEYEYTCYELPSSPNATKTFELTTGSVENIAGNLYTALRKNGHADTLIYSSDVVNVQNWLKNKVGSTSAAQKVNLAEINSYVTGILNGSITDTTELENMYNAFSANTGYTYPAAKKIYPSNATTYNITLEQHDQACESDWNTDLPEVVEALEFYQRIKNGYILVDDTQANSNEYLTNIVNAGAAIFNEVDKRTKTSFETSVSINTGLQEVSDETLLRKAEAKYEADMRKIDRKDRMYDTELAALDNERNAIKSEMETLKTVAKDNVERTFKLFG